MTGKGSIVCTLEFKHMLRVRLCLCLESADVEQIAVEAVIFVTPCRKARVIATRNRLKITGARTQPCLTPMLTMKGSDSSLFIITLAVIPS